MDTKVLISLLEESLRGNDKLAEISQSLEAVFTQLNDVNASLSAIWQDLNQVSEDLGQISQDLSQADVPVEHAANGIKPDEQVLS